MKHPLQIKEEEIIQTIQSGENKDQFKVLYEKYYHKVLDKCYSLIKNRSVARELAEDIFSKTFEKLSTFKKNSSFSTWLYSITYNHCIDYLREKKKLHYPKWNRENEIPEIIDESEEVLEDINYDQLLVILEQIHPEEKVLLMMKYNDNLSIKQISISLRVTENAAKMRLKRARSRVLYLYKERFLKHTK